MPGERRGVCARVSGEEGCVCPCEGRGGPCEGRGGVCVPM